MAGMALSADITESGRVASLSGFARTVTTGVVVCSLVWGLLGVGAHAFAESSAGASAPGNLARAKVYLAAGDYRRALEACQQEVNERPSAASYTYLTYIYHAIDGYVQQMAIGDQWGAVEGLYWNLAYRDASDLVDPPGGLARMAKEMIQDSVRHQGDMLAAMAMRLDRRTTDALWVQQKAWRSAAPDRWWSGVPEEWQW